MFADGLAIPGDPHPSGPASVGIAAFRTMRLRLAEEKMMNKLTQLTCMLAFGLVVGCTTHRTGSVAFLGIPETESSDRGPVGLINGQPCQIKNVSAVSETTYPEYQTAKRAGRVFAEETHGAAVYYAIKENRDVRFDNASAWVEVIERFKAKKP
jgi:hypothetical protein